MMKYLSNIMNNGHNKKAKEVELKTDQELEEARRKSKEANNKLKRSIDTRQESMKCLTRKIDLKIQQINGGESCPDDETKVFDIKKILEELDID